MKNEEYIVELGKALYDPDTGAAVFKPEFREKITRCRDCKHNDGAVCDYSAVYTRPNGFCQWAERREDAEVH